MKTRGKSSSSNYPPRIKPLSAAILMALAPASVFAASPTQLPGQGHVVQGNSSATTMTVNSQGQGNLTVSPTSPNSGVIIQWGGNALSSLNSSGTAGFNIGSGAHLSITANGSPSSLLNIDASGRPSQIMGALDTTALGAPVYVANANGIVVGGGAAINAPEGLGLVDADLTSQRAQTAFETGTLPLNFTNAGDNAGVNIEPGANLSRVDNFLLVAGAGNVNVSGTLGAASLVVDAGVGGYASSDGSFHPQDAGMTNYHDADHSAVTLNLGSASKPYDASATRVYSDGNITIAASSDLTNLAAGTMDTSGGTFDWTGTLTNEGTLNYGDHTANPSALGNIYNNTNTPIYGGMVNARSGEIDSGSFIFPFGTSFTNAGTMKLSQMQMMGSTMYMNPMLMITVSKGNIDLGGTVDVMGMGSSSMGSMMGSMPMTSPGLSMLMLMATTVPEQDVVVHTSSPLTIDKPMSGMMGMGMGMSTVPVASIDASHAYVDSSIIVNGGNFTYEPFGGTTRPTLNSFYLAKDATIKAQNLSMGQIAMNDTSPDAKYEDMTVYRINGSLDATGSMSMSSGSMTPGSVIFGGSMASKGTGPYANGSTNIPLHVSGKGSITAGSLVFNNAENDRVLASNLKINPPMAGGTTTITFNKCDDENCGRPNDK